MLGAGTYQPHQSSMFKASGLGIDIRLHLDVHEISFRDRCGVAEPRDPCQRLEGRKWAKATFVQVMSGGYDDPERRTPLIS